MKETIKNLKNSPVRVLVWSVKGGVGKTTIALNLHYLLNVGVITNEEYTILSSSIKNPKKLLILPEDREVPKVDKEYSIIFDFAGGIHRDKRVLDAIKQADIIIIPMKPNEPEIRGAIATVREIDKRRGLSKKILLVVNEYKSKQQLDVKRQLQCPIHVNYNGRFLGKNF